MPPRRITPVPVNTRAKTSMALHKLMKEQQNLLKKARSIKMNRNRMSGIVKNMLTNAYMNALMRQRPTSLSAYNIRSAVKNRGPNIRKRLFGNRNNK